MPTSRGRAGSTYWRLRRLAAEGHTEEARNLFASLASARPADIYARFSQKRAASPPLYDRPAVGDPSTATATYARVDELLRLRKFEEAAAEARLLAPSRGRDLRLAQAEFALGAVLDRRARDQARAPGDRHRRGGPRSGELAPVLLPDRRGRNPRDAGAPVRPRCLAAARSRSPGRACSTPASSRMPAPSA